MIRFWSISILLLAALNTCTFAATAGNAPGLPVARADQNGTEIRTDTVSSTAGVTAFANEVQSPHFSSSSFLNWYDSEMIHNARLVLAGALGFLLVLIGLHVLMPSRVGRQAKDPQQSSVSATGGGCSYAQHATPGNDATGHNQISGANTGNFLPLGVSLDHLNAIGQQMRAQPENESKELEELTEKIASLENRLRLLADGASKPLQPCDTTSHRDSSTDQNTPDSHPNSVESKVDSYSSSVMSEDLQTDQQNENVRSHPRRQSQKNTEQTPLFDSLISETLAVIHSQ